MSGALDSTCGSPCGKTTRSPVASGIGDPSSTQAHPVPSVTTWYGTRWSAPGKIPPTIERPAGVAATHGSTAQISKKTAPVRRTARSTSDSASIIRTIGTIARMRGHSRASDPSIRSSHRSRARARADPDGRSTPMPLFLDVHDHIEGLTADAVTQAHQADLQTQEKYGVKILRYWFDEGNGKVFCLID